MLTAGVIVSCYNGARWIGDALRSALRQTRPAAGIVVVDDGSTDDTPAALRDFAAGVTVVRKDNGGQLSCFNAALPRSAGDVVFFLDADDAWEPDYLADVLAVYERDPAVDGVFCSHRRFGRVEDPPRAPPADVDYGVTSALAYFSHYFVGGPTSTLSFRRALLDRLLPLPLESDWRIGADNCLVLGASVLGGAMYFRGSDRVRYRLHEDNAWAGRRATPLENYRRLVATARLVEHVRARAGIPEAALIEGIGQELRTGAKPARLFREYRRMIRRLPRHRATSLFRVWAAQVRRARARPAPAPRVPAGEAGP